MFRHIEIESVYAQLLILRSLKKRFTFPTLEIILKFDQTRIRINVGRNQRILNKSVCLSCFAYISSEAIVFLGTMYSNVIIYILAEIISYFSLISKNVSQRPFCVACSCVKYNIQFVLRKHFLKYS